MTSEKNYAKIPIWFISIFVVIVISAIAWGANIQSRVAVLESQYQTINQKLDTLINMHLEKK